MRWTTGRIVVAIGLVALNVRRTDAQPEDEFPDELVDRPIVSPSGMTVFDPSYQFRTYMKRYTDASGAVTYRRTGFADDRTPDLSVSHAFGPVVIGLGLGTLGRIYVSSQIPSLPLSITLGADFSARQPDGRYAHDQYLRLRYKLLPVPHRLALFATLTAYVAEARLYDSMHTLVEGTGILASAGTSAQLQLSPHWCVAGRVTAGAPLYTSVDFDAHAVLGTGVSVILGFRKWDFFVDGDLDDVTRRPTTFLNIGFARRWGL